MQRGGFPFRTVILALFVVGTVYLLYLYNTTLGRLRDAELSAERYRREEETKVAQLQDVMRNKDELQEKCDNDKREFTNRLNSLNQQHKMLKSQYDEHEVEQMRLEQEARRLKEEFEQVETQRNQEYQQLKQEKELEISNLKDQIANMQRQNDQLLTQISSLKTQVQNGHNQVQYDQGLLRSMESEITSLKQQLANKNSQLLNQQQQVPVGQNNAINNFQQQQQPNQGLNFDANAQQQLVQQQQLQQQQQQQQLMQGAGFGQQGGVANMNIGNAGDTNLAVQQAVGGMNAGNVQEGLGSILDQQQQQQQQQQQLDVNNEQHQVMPPNNDVDRPDAPVNGNVDGHHMQQEQVRDEDHQVMPPDLNAHNVDDNKAERNEGMGGGAGDKVEEHEDPLDLKQMAAPDLGDRADGGGHGGELQDDVMQQQPPVNRAVGRNAAEEEEEEEEEDEDQYHDDKYEDDNDNNNNNVHINPDPIKADADYH